MYNKQLHHMKQNIKQTDLICIVDTDGNILYYNNYNDISNKFGSDDVIGKPFLTVYPWLTRETSTLLKVLDKGEPIVNELQSIMVDQNFSVNSINSAFPLKNKSRLIGAMVISVNLNNESETNPKKNDINPVRFSSLQAKYSFDDIITTSKELENTKNKLRKAALRDSNIFIYGETGTGKELFAHSIHNASKRREKAFITQNCAAIPSTLIESILFGTTKGSFTGAQDKKGIFEIADGGTLFLDEINSMPLDMQVKLLRVIEEKRVRRIGGHKEIPVDTRIIASTNERPEKLVLEGKFRMDLFYRLNVVSVEVPPLRNRKEDIDYLSDYFINYFNQVFNENIKGIHPDAQTILNMYDWPGNVRELKNCIEGAFNLAEDLYITYQDLSTHITLSVSSSGEQPFLKDQSLAEKMDSYEQKIIKEGLEQTNYNIAKTAKLLKAPRQTIYNKMKKYGLAREES